MEYSTHHQPMRKIVDRGKTVEESAALRKLSQYHTFKDVLPILSYISLTTDGLKISLNNQVHKHNLHKKAPNSLKPKKWVTV